MSQLNILFIGDIIGKYGRQITRELLPDLKKEYVPDLTIANGENSAHGYGITEKVYKELCTMGIDVITMGNHVWDKKEFVKTVDKCPKVIRPANYPPGVPGRDHIIIESRGTKIGIINLIGRVFMQALDCPFRVGEALVNKLREETPIILVDIHAEATSEKCALAYFLDGKVSAVIGTHTHVMTADERILPGGTAFISDLGMVGSYDSIIGMDRKAILARFLTQMPHKFEPAEKGTKVFNAIFLKIDPASGKAQEIKRIYKVVKGNA